MAPRLKRVRPRAPGARARGGDAPRAPASGAAPIAALPSDAVFAPVRSQTAFEETVDRLGTAIKLGLLPPGARLPADEHLGGDVERQLLGGAVELKAAAGLPTGDAAGDRRIHPVHVPDESLVLERLLHDPPVMAVLVEVHEHHAAVEERADQRIPSELVGVALRNGKVLLGLCVTDAQRGMGRHAPMVGRRRWLKSIPGSDSPKRRSGRCDG